MILQLLQLIFPNDLIIYPFNPNLGGRQLHGKGGEGWADSSSPTNQNLEILMLKRLLIWIYCYDTMNKNHCEFYDS